MRRFIGRALLALLAFILLGEVPTSAQISGAALVLTGILVVEYRPRPSSAAPVLQK